MKLLRMHEKSSQSRSQISHEHMFTSTLDYSTHMDNHSITNLFHDFFTKISVAHYCKPGEIQVFKVARIGCNIIPDTQAI